jgi:hypothetical protein
LKAAPIQPGSWKGHNFHFEQLRKGQREREEVYTDPLLTIAEIKSRME